jgi:FkbM family methyltransferase
MKSINHTFRQLRLLASRIRIPKGRRAVRQVTIHGFEMLVLANEDVGRHLMLFHDYEPEETAFFQKSLRPDDICLDVGGNVGYFSMIMGLCAGQGQIHVFEPIPLNAALVRVNAELNALHHLTVNNVAVEKGTTQFSIAMDSAYSSMHATGRVAEERSISVPIVSLDDYVAEHSLPRVDILKVDVEGAEGLVVGGAARLLSGNTRPRLILLELFDENLSPFGTSVQALIDRMVAMDYRPKVLDRSKSLKDYEPAMANKIYNIFFVAEH